VDGESRFRKARMQADRGDGGAAKATLRNLAGELGASALKVRALVVLGDLPASDGDHETARHVLREAAVLDESLDDFLDDFLDEVDDLADYETHQARDILERLA
jgi:hypothetical protein